MSNIRRATQFIGLALPAFAIATLMSSDRPAAAQTVIGGVSYNLGAGNDELGPNRNERSVGMIIPKGRDAAPRPWTVSTQETCRAIHLAQMIAQFQPMGYTPDFANTSNSGPACWQYGNGLFLLGTSRGDAWPTERADWRYNWQWHRTDPNSSAGYPCQLSQWSQCCDLDGLTECRRLLCRRMNGGPSGVYTGCVTHLATQSNEPPSGSSVNTAQSWDALAAIQNTWPGGNKVLGADLNRTWQNMSRWIAQFREVDR